MNKLKDDCIREVANYLDFPQLVFFSDIDQRFKNITSAKRSRLSVLPSNVGTIEGMNFRYLLEMFSSSIQEMSFSLRVFPLTPGYYYDYKVRQVLQVIYNCSCPQLKKIFLHDFHSYSHENKDFEHFVKLLSVRGTEVIEINE